MLHVPPVLGARICGTTHAIQGNGRRRSSGGGGLDVTWDRAVDWVSGGLSGAVGEGQALGGAGASRGTPSSVTSRMRAWIAVRPCRAARSARCSPVSR